MSNLANIKVNVKENRLTPVKEVLTATIDRGSSLTGVSSSTTTTTITQVANIPPFGTNTNLIVNYPNDSVQLNIFNAVNLYLETNYRVTDYNYDQDTITVDPEKNLADLNYISGKYQVNYKFYRNHLGSGDGHKLQIQEISADGLELRVVPVLSTQYDNTNFLNAFQSDFFAIPKAQTLTNLFLFKDANTSMHVFDYVQDKFTISTTPYSIIFKLTTPIPVGVVVGDFVWLSQEVNDSLVDNITVTPPKNKTNNTYILGPNWDAINKGVTSTSTVYKDWDDLLSTNVQTSQDIVNKLLSSSFIEGMPLNVDYRDFSNFVNFGTAEERLNNFMYKMELLESYDTRIGLLTSQSSATSSVYYQNNVLDAKTKKAALIGSFDGYEKYLYYQSSSYVTNSYGEFYPSTWPKSNYTVPYVNYSTTSSQVESWFSGIIASASLFDQNNPNALYRIIPEHITQDPANEGYTAFVNMIGHYFDLMFVYVKHMSKIYNREQSTLEGFSKDLIYHVAKNLGVDFEDGNTIDELWSYALGTSTSGSLTTTYGDTTQDKTKETWKRIINNLPYLLKTKGTERGVRALINCFGIPQTILRITEYGGSEPEFDTATDLVYDRFNYSTVVGYNGKTSGQAAQQLYVHWSKLYNNYMPMTTQLRVKMAPNQTKTQTILEVSNKWKIQAFQSGGQGYIGFYLGNKYVPTVWATASVASTIYDGTWHNIALRREVLTDASQSNQTYTLIVKKTNFDKVVSTQTASLYIDGSTSSSYNATFCSSSTTNNAEYQLWIPGTGSFLANTSQSMNLFTGSIQEFRYWGTALQDSILDNHALSPTSYQGNTDGTQTGSTSSFNDLYFRLCLGSDNKKIDYSVTTSYYSQHPYQQRAAFSGSNTTYQSASFFNFASSSNVPNVETFSQEWPDLSGNRSIANKIRIDETFLASDQLYLDARAEKPLTDNYPPDSSRLGVFLSPTNEVNQDIAEQFGGISIDEYIGDPSQQGMDYYPDLKSLRSEYIKKYRGRNKTQNYIRLLQYYDAALFQLIKRFVPYRANTQVGLVVESDLLHRNKLPFRYPSYEDNTYSASLDLTSTNVAIPGGYVEDGYNEFTPGPDYVPEAVIDSSTYVTISGESTDESVENYEILSGFVPEGDLTETSLITLSGVQNQYNNSGVADLPSQSGSLEGLVDLGISAYGRNTREYGSQYLFMSYGNSGSTVIPITSSYDEPILPIVLGGKLSEFANVAGDIYNVDILGGKAFTSGSVVSFTSPITLQNSNWTRLYGLKFGTYYTNSLLLSDPYSVTNGEWNFSPLDGIGLGNSNGVAITASAQIPTFFYDVNDPTTYDYLYQIDLGIVRNANQSGKDKIVLSFGGYNSSYTQTILDSDLDAYVGSIIPTHFRFITKADGPNTAFTIFQSASFVMRIKSLNVQCLNYRADVQDYHLQDSYGMRNARYDGSKLTSADFNTNSPDTSDGGPVVQITVGNANQLSIAKPGPRGTLQVK